MPNLTLEQWLLIATGFAAMGQVSSALVAAFALLKTAQLQEKQMLLERRQLLIPLWEQLRQVAEVDPSNPVWFDVIKAVNSLELMAVCWEGQLIDEAILRRMYRTQFIELYQAIEECKNPPPNIGKDGKQMLLACPAAIRLYSVLMAEHAEENKLLPLH